MAIKVQPPKLYKITLTKCVSKYNFSQFLRICTPKYNTIEANMKTEKENKSSIRPPTINLTLLIGIICFTFEKKHATLVLYTER